MQLLLVTAVMSWLVSVCCHDLNAQGRAPAISFDRGYGAIEVGGPYAGIEMHHSRPLPSRVSFYSPVANSIDLSTDYFKRDESQILQLDFQMDSGPKQMIGREPWPYRLSPASVVFAKQINQTHFRITYSFCQTAPGLVAEIVAFNQDNKAHDYRIDTRWEMSLRTCQSYKLKDQARTRFDAQSQTIFADFDNPETVSATIIVGNAAQPPANDHSNGATARLASANGHARPAAVFAYEKKLAPNDSIVIVQFLASTTRSDDELLAQRLRRTYGAEIETYESEIAKAALDTPKFRTGNGDLDFSAQWAKAMLAANRHYLDGDVVPMPCPAQYNFFFTHDALLTDLAAANFDAKRVRGDLSYLAKRANVEHVIPHAYYWKDDGFKTEFASPDNWNHFWFILVSASYLRHTGDTAFLQQLLPLLEKSLSSTLSHLHADSLLWARYPDWWDIGNVPGPRAYMTALAIRSLQDFAFVGSHLSFPSERLRQFEHQAGSLQKALSERLWDDQLGYLINYNDGQERDEHLYAGSLLASVFDLLPLQQSQRLVNTATQRLFDPNLGVRTVDPVDFHLLEEKFQFVNHEQGGKGIYINGGVWPHCTAWYALALQKTGNVNEAFEILLNNMSLAGTTSSPNGQPAMYEYRISDRESADYGRVDKPNFLWAGGWYLLTLYRLLGANESPWNLRLLTELPDSTPAPEFDWLIQGKMTKVKFSGHGNFASAILFNGKPHASLVIPAHGSAPDEIEIKLGEVRQPYLEQLTAMLLSAEWSSSQNTLTLNTKAFPGHEGVATICSPSAVRKVLVDGEEMKSGWKAAREMEGVYRISVPYRFAKSECTVALEL